MADAPDHHRTAGELLDRSYGGTVRKDRGVVSARQMLLEILEKYCSVEVPGGVSDDLVSGEVTARSAYLDSALRGALNEARSREVTPETAEAAAGDSLTDACRNTDRMSD